MGEISRFGCELRSVHAFPEEGAVVTDASPDDFCRGHGVRACVFLSVIPSHVQARGQSIHSPLSISSASSFGWFPVRFVHAFPRLRVWWDGATLFRPIGLVPAASSSTVSTTCLPSDPLRPRLSSLQSHPTRCVSIFGRVDAHLFAVTCDPSSSSSCDCPKCGTPALDPFYSVSSSVLPFDRSLLQRDRSALLPPRPHHPLPSSQKGGIRATKKDGGRRPSCAPLFSPFLCPCEMDVEGWIPSRSDWAALKGERCGWERNPRSFSKGRMRCEREGRGSRRQTHPSRVGEVVDVGRLRPYAAMANANPFALLDEDGENNQDDVQKKSVPGARKTNGCASTTEVTKERKGGVERQDTKGGKRNTSNTSKEGRTKCRELTETYDA